MNNFYEWVFTKSRYYPEMPLADHNSIKMAYWIPFLGCRLLFCLQLLDDENHAEAAKSASHTFVFVYKYFNPSVLLCCIFSWFFRKICFASHPLIVTIPNPWPYFSSTWWQWVETMWPNVQTVGFTEPGNNNAFTLKYSWQAIESWPIWANVSLKSTWLY